MKKYILLCAVATLTNLFLLPPLARADGNTCRGDRQLHIEGTRLYAEIANDEKTRRYGLMFRREMGQGCGMLLVFSSEKNRTFTMRNTLIPLDIASIDSNGIIREIITMQPGGPRYPSNVVSRYALQMNAGWFSRHAIATGAKVQLATEDIPAPISTLQTK